MEERMLELLILSSNKKQTSRHHDGKINMVMKMKYKFSSGDRAEIEKIRKTNRDKQTEKRLKVLSVRCGGKTSEKISSAAGFHRSHISNLVRKYFDEGLASISEKHYSGNWRNMSIEEEKVFLEPYRERAKQGQLVEVRETAAAYEKKVGHRIGKGQIYRVLRRHGWRKFMPRSKHPKKAGEEVIAASKKLTHELQN